MANFVPRRDRPVDPSNRYPRGPAYACSTEKDYRIAEDTYRLAYQSRSEAHDGLYASMTIIIFNNWITSLTKLRRHDEAEAQWRSKLQSMEASSMQESPCFVYVQCNLATSLYLSGHLPAAEELFYTIRARQDVLADDLATRFFEVLSLVRLTKDDCLVFRECSAKVPGLIPVKDYTALQDGKCSKKRSLRSSIISLRRIASLGQGIGRIGAREHAKDIDRPSGLLRQILRLDRNSLLSTSPRMSSISASSLPIADSGQFLQHDTSVAPSQQYTCPVSPNQWSITNTFLQPALIMGEAGPSLQLNPADISQSSDKASHEAPVSPIVWPMTNALTHAALITAGANPPSQPGSTYILNSSDEIELTSDNDLVVTGESVSPLRLLAEHSLHPPSTWRNSFDASQGGAHRSQQTTTSSVSSLTLCNYTYTDICL